MRIRSVKPEFWTSEAIASLDHSTRLLFIGLWNYADDQGRGVDNPSLIRAALFPLDDEQFSTEDVTRSMNDLEAAGRIVRYEAAGRKCFYIPRWEEHQHPSKPRPSTLPDPSLTLPFPVPADSQGEGKGREGIGREGKSEPATRTPNQDQAEVLLADDTRPQYFIRRLIEVDERWAKVTASRLMGLSKSYGPGVVITALEHIYETPPVLESADPYGYLNTVCRSLEEAS